MPDNSPYTLPAPELEAELYYLTPEEGGRKTPALNGYRGQLYYNGRDWDAPQQFLDQERVYPGDTIRVYLQTLSTEYHVGHFFVGQEIATREGGTTIAKGKVTKVLRPDFNYWDGATFLKSLDPSIKPYFESTDIQDFQADFKQALKRTDLFEDIQFEMTGNLECMMRVRCKLRYGRKRSREINDQLLAYWKTELAFSSRLYKLQLPLPYDSFTNRLVYDSFILSFATWHSHFITGQITVE